jgi:type III pantothenate kinase
MNLLTADLGNSRTKLRAWSASSREPVAALDLASDPAAASEIAPWLATIPPIGVVGLCSVAGTEVEAAIAGALRRNLPNARIESAPDPGLELRVREPDRVGRDRLFAARAALDLCGASIVVSAGTALTVDAVRADATFLGGAIAPGPALLARSLAEGTARLPSIEPRAHPAALGRDTRAALEAGVGVGFRGAAKELVERVAEESGLGRVPVVLTGGARAFLLDPPVYEGRRLVVEEDLVHLGILRALDPSGPRPRAMSTEVASWTSRSPS